MYPESYWVNTKTGELKIVGNPSDYREVSSSKNWKQISAEEYATFCQAVIYAMNTNIINS